MSTWILSEFDLHYMSIINKIKECLHGNGTPESVITDAAEILHDDIDTLANYLAEALRYAIKHNLKLGYQKGICDEINIVLEEEHNRDFPIVFEIAYFYNDSLKCIIFMISLYHTDVHFRINFDDLISLSDKILALLSEEEQTYLLLKGVDVNAFINDAYNLISPFGRK